jgi:hypothetical protein
MAKKPEPSMKDKPTKFEYTFEDDESISIWKYDKKKFPNGPISVEFKWKPEFTNRMKLLQKQEKEAKKTKTKTNEKVLNKFK